MWAAAAGGSATDKANAITEEDLAGPGQYLRYALRWLREGKLVQVLLLYLGASWGIIQITEIFIEQLGLPAWFFPAAILLLLIGLVVITATALVQSGAAVGRPTGFEPEALPKEIMAGRLPTLTWPRAIIGGVLAFGALGGAGVAIAVFRGDEAPVVAEASGNSLAVLPFRSTGEELELWREGLMDVLSANLDVGDVRAVDSRAVLSRWRSRFGEEEVPAEQATSVARELGARWAIIGQAVELGGQVRIDARVYDAETAEALASASVQGPPDSMLLLTEGLTLDLLRGLGEEEGIGAGGKAFMTTSLGAVKHYLEGEQAMRRSQWDSAIEAFERALDVDSTFAAAAARLSLAYGWRYPIGNNPDAEAATALALRFADDLPPRERAILEATYLMEAGRSEAIDIAQRLTERYPDSPEAWYWLGETRTHLGFVRGIPIEQQVAPFDRALALDSSFIATLIHPIERSGQTNQLDKLENYARMYLAHDSTSLDGQAMLAAYDLVRTRDSDPAPAYARLASLSRRTLVEVMLILQDNPWLMDALERVVYELAAPRYPADQRSTSLTFNIHALEIWRGRTSSARDALSAAEELQPDNPFITYFHLRDLAHGRGDASDAERLIQRIDEAGFLRRATARWVLAMYYLQEDDPAGVRDQAEALTLLADSLGADADSLGAVVTGGLALGIDGLLAAQRGEHREAAATLRRSIPFSSGYGGLRAAVMDQRFALARSLAELGEELEVLRILEGFDGNTYYDVPAALARAQLYEKRGEREKAIAAYSRVVKLWEGADPELKSTWETAQRSLSRLTSESP